MANDVEVCVGCGEAQKEVPSEFPKRRFPWVGVTRDEDGKMAAFPICDACHKDPAHRKYLLKMHFFSAGHADVAVDSAERNILVGLTGRVPDSRK